MTTGNPAPVRKAIEREQLPSKRAVTCVPEALHGTHSIATLAGAQ